MTCVYCRCACPDFVPSFSYFATLNGQDVPAWLYASTTFIWKCESFAMAAIWFSNMRVRAAVLEIPWVYAVYAWACCVAAKPEPQAEIALGV